jgi:hypothetical protein
MSRNPPPPGALAFLEAVRGLLLRDGVWIKGHLCTDKKGRPVGYWDERACHFSLEGAILRVSHITRQPAAPIYLYVQRAISPSRITALANWNDSEGVTHTAVVALLNRCIMQLGGQAYDLFQPEGD